MTESRHLNKIDLIKFQKKIGFKYHKYNYKVEKILSVQDNKPIMDINLSGHNIYVLHNYSHNFRFLYITSKKLKMDTIIYGKSLIFYKTPTKLTNEDTKIYLSKEYNNLNEMVVKLSVNPLDLKSTNKFPLYTYSLFYTEVYNPDSQEMKIKKIHKHNLHDTRIAYDNDLWFIKEINNLKIKDIPLTILKNILNQAIIDEKLKKVLITEFFILDQFKDEEELISQDYMMMNSHCIILTQGGTGKSSILCMLGNDLHTTTDAGMFGYMDIVAGSWRSGEVSKTKDSIIVDEINEIIKKNSKKGESVLDILNTPLENGKYSYGKAGGMKIQFGNQFNFLGNISDEFHFENFVNGLSGNQSTMGRRFAYIIYDDNLEFVNGEHRDIIKHLNKIKPLKEFLSFILLWFLKTKKFQDRKVRKNKYMLNIIKEFQEKYKKIINNMEHPNTKQFFKSFTSHSLENRIPVMALKLTIFKYIELFRSCHNSNKQFNSIDLRQFWKQFYIEFKFLLNDNLISLDNILSHQNTGMITADENNKIFNQIKVLKKSQRNMICYIVGNSKNIKGIKLLEENCEYLSIVKRLKLKVTQKNQTKFLDELSQFGFNYYITTSQKKKHLNFTITNKSKFQKVIDSVIKNFNNLITDLKEKEKLEIIFNKNFENTKIKTKVIEKKPIKEEIKQKEIKTNADLIDEIDFEDLS